MSTMMANQETRKRRFLAALALQGETRESWARANQVQATYLSRVLSGKVTSRPLMRRVDAYADEHLKAALVNELLGKTA